MFRYILDIFEKVFKASFFVACATGELNRTLQTERELPDIGRSSFFTFESARGVRQRCLKNAERDNSRLRHSAALRYLNQLGDLA